MEIWKNIKGVSSHYLVSNKGRVKSVNPKWAKRELKLVKHFMTNGYHRVAIYDDSGARKKYLVHRLVALAFIDNPENKPQVNHISGDKNDNSLSNLEWNTGSENISHAFRNKLISVPKGQDNYASKLTDLSVLTLRTLPLNMVNGFAKSNNIAPETARRAYCGDTWSHLPGAVSYERKSTKKLSDSEVTQIRSMLSKGMKHREIAPIYGIHVSYVSKLATNTRRV